MTPPRPRLPSSPNAEAVRAWLAGAMRRFRTAASLESLARSLFRGDSDPTVLRAFAARLERAHEDLRASEAHKSVVDALHVGYCIFTNLINNFICELCLLTLYIIRPLANADSVTVYITCKHSFL